MVNMSKTRKCPGRESFLRMNYLYQASNVLATESPAASTASNMYLNLMVAVGKKTVQRLDINVKRTICKGCRSLLLAGITCRVRIKKKRAEWTCQRCGTRKIFHLNNPNYRLWPQTEESIVEILDYKNETPN